MTTTSWCDDKLIDECRPEILLKRIAFGSCAKQYLSQSFWQDIESRHNPQLWIYSGDAFYTSAPVGSKWTSSARRDSFPGTINTSRSLSALRDASESALRVKEYVRFRDNLEAGVIGTIDDHDFGVNDGGGGVGYRVFGGLDQERHEERDERKHIFLDFLGVDKSPVHPRRVRKGVYSSHLYGTKSSGLVKVVLLDTRFARDEFVIPTDGRAFFGAGSRLLSGSLGLHNLQHGRILDTDQWQWLEQQFIHSRKHDVKHNIIVSSFQVLTSNPVVESWSHFPKEQSRLLSLFAKYEPQGLLVISGDIHSAELLRASSVAAEAPSPLEVTSSGLTHDCSSGKIPRWMCEGLLRVFSVHRPLSNDHEQNGIKAKNITITSHTNYGIISLMKNQTTTSETFDTFEVGVHHLRSGEHLFGFTRKVDDTRLSLPSCAYTSGFSCRSIFFEGMLATYTLIVAIVLSFFLLRRSRI